MRVFVEWQDFYGRLNLSFIPIWVVWLFRVQQFFNRVDEFADVQSMRIIPKKNIVFEGGEEQAKLFKSLR